VDRCGPLDRKFGPHTFDARAGRPPASSGKTSTSECFAGSPFGDRFISRSLVGRQTVKLARSANRERRRYRPSAMQPIWAAVDHQHLHQRLKRSRRDPSPQGTE